MTDFPRNDELADPGPATFEVLYKNLRRKIPRYVARKVSDREKAIEIVSDIWMVTYVRFESDDPPPRDWNQFIWGIARNKVNDWLRATYRTPPPLYLDPPDLERVAGEVFDEPDLGQVDEARRLRNALAYALEHDLTELQREAVDLRFSLQMTYAEIAAVMKVSRSTAKKHVERGVVAARKALAKAGFIIPKTKKEAR